LVWLGDASRRSVHRRLCAEQLGFRSSLTGFPNCCENSSIPQSLNPSIPQSFNSSISPSATPHPTTAHPAHPPTSFFCERLAARSSRLDKESSGMFAPLSCLNPRIASHLLPQDRSLNTIASSSTCPQGSPSLFSLSLLVHQLHKPLSIDASVNFFDESKWPTFQRTPDSESVDIQRLSPFC
jgi:hypothetical protein